MRLHIALVHYPVLDRKGHRVTTSVTNLDIHDFVRIALTFDVEKAFMVTPITQQREMIQYVKDAWIGREDSSEKKIRSRAFARLEAVPSIEAVQNDILKRTGSAPFTITTSATKAEGTLSFAEAQQKISSQTKPSLLLFGTGWGLTPEVHQAADARLEPIRAHATYNHLPVRAAIAMILDRLVPEPSPANLAG